MTENPSPQVPIDEPEHPEVGDTDAQRRQDQNRLDDVDPDQQPNADEHPQDAPPSDIETTETYEGEGGAAADGPVAIT